MNVEVISRSAEMIERSDYRDAIKIRIDGETVFSVSDGEPEDANLSRDFSDAYNVPELLQKAFEAGRSGETIKIVDIKSDDI